MKNRFCVSLSLCACLLQGAEQDQNDPKDQLRWAVGERSVERVRAVLEENKGDTDFNNLAFDPFSLICRDPNADCLEIERLFIDDKRFKLALKSGKWLPYAVRFPNEHTVPFVQTAFNHARVNLDIKHPSDNRTAEGLVDSLPSLQHQAESMKGYWGQLADFFNRVAKI